MDRTVSIIIALILIVVTGCVGPKAGQPSRDIDETPAPEGAEAIVTGSSLSLGFPLGRSDRFDLPISDGSVEVAWLADVEMGSQQYRLGFTFARPAGTAAETIAVTQLLQRGKLAFWVPQGESWVEDSTYGGLTASALGDTINISCGDATFIQVLRAARPPFSTFQWGGTQNLNATDTVSIAYE